MYSIAVQVMHSAVWQLKVRGIQFDYLTVWHAFIAKLKDYIERQAQVARIEDGLRHMLFHRRQWHKSLIKNPHPNLDELQAMWSGSNVVTIDAAATRFRADLHVPP